MPLLVTLSLILGAFAPGLGAANPSNRQADVVRTSVGDVRLMPIFHGSVMLEFGGKIVHIDPWSQGDYAGLPPADLIVITHTHADHLDRMMVDMLHKDNTIIVSPPAVADTLNCAPRCGTLQIVGDSGRRTVLGIGFEGVPMYNLVQGSAPDAPFHNKGIGSGYVLTFGGTRMYFSGDTECVPEIKALKNIDIAFLAMNPPRTMSVSEGADCAKAFRPKVLYPYHYRGSKLEELTAALKGSPMEVRIRKLEGEP